MVAKRKKDGLNIDPVLSKGIITIIILVFAIIVSLSFFNKAGTIGEILNNYLLSFLFGSVRYAVPVIIVILSYFFIKNENHEYKLAQIMGAFLFFLAVTGIIHINFPLNEMWLNTLEGKGGGVFGMFAWPLKKYLGDIAGIIFLSGIILTAILMLFNTSLGRVFQLNKMAVSLLKKITGIFYAGLKTPFSLTKNKTAVSIRGDYHGGNEPEEETIEEDQESENLEKRNFATKNLNSNNEEINKKEPQEEDGDVVNEEQEKQKNNSGIPLWLQNVIIKDLPPLTLLSNKKSKPTSGDIKSNVEIIKDTLQQFNIEVDMGEVRVGPAVTQYSLKPAKGVKLSRITGLSNDLALSLAAHPIRIEAPIPGKSLVGIEVPNQKTALVSFKELLESREYLERPHNMMVALGKDVGGKVWFGDLPRMPHLLIAGATGSGKTVCVNTIILSLLYENTAQTLRMILVDPKRVELTLYNGIPHLLTPVITNVQKTVNALKWTIGEMERRFEVLSQVGSRDIASYNKRYPDKALPHIVFVIDELADLMAAAASEVEAGIIRLAQMARAVGIHLILATQRPSVDVITGLMKANIPARVAFSVASLIDSRTILDSPGAEKLLGRGDMLFQTAELSKPVRIQGSFISEEELKNVVDYLKGDEEPEYDESIVNKASAEAGTMSLFGGPTDDQDLLFEEAKKIILEAGKASASLLQRRLKVGYARAARILDELEEAKIIGPADGAKPREILVSAREIDTTMDTGNELNVFENENLEYNNEQSEEKTKENEQQT